MAQASSVAPPNTKTGWPASNIMFHGMRNATPDSDALASSDDENDQLQPMHSVAQQNMQRYARRASWLSDTQSLPRKVSFTATSGSQPPTPSSEQTGWISATAGNRPSTSGGSFPWGTNIWSQEGKKDPPARLTEIMPSKTSTTTAARRASGVQPRPSFSEEAHSSAFPFSIPLHPTPKTYRSMSYSVGQMDDEEDAVQGGAPLAQSNAGAYSNAGGHFPVNRYSSKPSNELLRGHSGLGQLQEDESEAYGDAVGQRNSTDVLDSAAKSLADNLKLKNSQYPGNRVFDEPGLKPDIGKPRQWQTSLGFGGLPEDSQSRRHSFAAGEGIGLQEASTLPGLPFSRDVMARRNDPPPNYFSSASRPNVSVEQFDQRQWPNSQADYMGPGITAKMAQDMANHEDMTNHYVVTFKCSRAEVFYIPHNMGLEVKPGDMVIVEADRGYDIGTVMYAELNMRSARMRKEELAIEHHRWLTTFSKSNRKLAEAALQGKTLPGPGFNANTVIPGEQHGGRAKLIKSLARPHEIHLLTDKEGNEEKAKRICQHKVAEHHLPMEILDAEFQLDFKKLTFYYYAETYIDFTNLVGDLFKVWKTRIWMSAINPASFASAHQGNNAPVGLGPGVVSQSGESTYSPLSGPSSRGRGSRRQQAQQHNTVPQQGMYTQSGGLMYWIPPPDQGSAPVCLGTALSPEEAAGAQARMQHPAQPGNFGQSYQPPMSTSSAGNYSGPAQYQGPAFTGGNFGQGTPQYTSFPNHGNTPTPVNVSSSNTPSGPVATSGPSGSSLTAGSAGQRSKWDQVGGPRVGTDRPHSSGTPHASAVSPNPNTPSGQWFNHSPAAPPSMSGLMKSYDPYANEFVPGRTNSSSRNETASSRQT
ncbi:MAG: hypothetical protein M1822_009945 [Bathelium mastoideum]|nr:MAG: hypothetical protein M1822_009945 [Bathelium mastoideum]